MDTPNLRSVMHVSGHKDGSARYYWSRKPLKHIALARRATPESSNTRGRLRQMLILSICVR